MAQVRLTVNGTERVIDDVAPGASLLWLLRERLDLPGTKNACEQGECGACHVYLDDTLVCACLVAAAQATGGEVRTVEDLTVDGALDRIQRCFLRHGAVQCGFCTPGLLMTAHDLVRRVGSPSEGEIREALAGNLCRCTGYELVLAAVREATQEIAQPESDTIPEADR